MDGEKMRTLTTAVLVAFAGLAFGQETNTAALPSLDELLPSTEGDASLAREKRIRAMPPLQPLANLDVS